MLSLAAAFPQNASELETLRVASALFRSDHPDAAILALREHLNSHPEDAAARMELARDLSFAKRFRESEQQYSILLQQDPANLHARVGMAKIASWQGDWDLALGRYDAVLQRSPRFYDALVGKGFTLWWMGRKDEAASVFATATRMHPDDREVRDALRQLGTESPAPASREPVITGRPKESLGTGSTVHPRGATPDPVSSFPEPVAPTASLPATPARTNWWLFGAGGGTALFIVFGYARWNARRSLHAKAARSRRDDPAPAPAPPKREKPERLRHEMSPNVVLLERSAAAREFQRSVLNSLGAATRCPESVADLRTFLGDPELDLVIIDPHCGEPAEADAVIAWIGENRGRLRFKVAITLLPGEPDKWSQLVTGCRVFRRPVRIADLAALVVADPPTPAEPTPARSLSAAQG